ncbi:putative metalloprotease CJM1_0395 family protein [Desulfovibrio sp. ZJ369]|uniref:putative metalloprotease CJM1_0395 family protein n=1 Tax=Desulfovibrio sp. ZJ369 TaxID=2709793 RepID=UPI0013E9A115|nr:putative metalloprotease CJM1_0395 family protein [Desulfovibrio sp. ZJ369]
MGEPLESISTQAITGIGPEAGGREKQESGRADLAGRSARADARGASSFADSLTLSPEAQSQLRALQQRDAKVRSHEQAHLAAGGGHVTGGASYTYQKGPDGRQYAIGGQVSIDVSAVPGDAEATREKARQVRRAALAPGEPSGQDRQVAAKAARLEAQAAQDELAGSPEEKQDPGVSPEVAGRSGGAGPMDLAAASTARIRRLPDPAEEGGRGVSSAGDILQHLAAAQDRAASRAAGVYAAMAMRGTMPTALAPAGTGISLEV